MMTIINSYSLYALLVSNVMLLAAATIAILRFQGLLRSSAAFWDSPTGSILKMQSDQNAISELMDERFSSMQGSINEIGQKVGVVQLPMTENLPFDNAVRMAKQGASLEDLTRHCGLNKGEAQLLMRVHKRSSLQPCSN